MFSSLIGDWNLIVYVRQAHIFHDSLLFYILIENLHSTFLKLCYLHFPAFLEHILPLNLMCCLVLTDRYTVYLYTQALAAIKDLIIRCRRILFYVKKMSLKTSLKMNMRIILFCILKCIFCTVNKTIDCLYTSNDYAFIFSFVTSSISTSKFLEFQLRFY